MLYDGYIVFYLSNCNFLNIFRALKFPIANSFVRFNSRSWQCRKTLLKQIRGLFNDSLPLQMRRKQV